MNYLNSFMKETWLGPQRGNRIQTEISIYENNEEQMYSFYTQTET